MVIFCGLQVLLNEYFSCRLAVKLSLVESGWVGVYVVRLYNNGIATSKQREAKAL